MESRLNRGPTVRLVGMVDSLFLFHLFIEDDDVVPQIPLGAETNYTRGKGIVVSSPGVQGGIP